MADKVIGIFMAFILLSALAAVLSRKAQTGKVLDSIFKGFQGAQKAALSPITG